MKKSGVTKGFPERTNDPPVSGGLLLHTAIVLPLIAPRSRTGPRTAPLSGVQSYARV